MAKQVKKEPKIKGYKGIITNVAYDGKTGFYILDLEYEKEPKFDYAEIVTIIGYTLPQDAIDDLIDRTGAVMYTQLTNKEIEVYEKEDSFISFDAYRH